MNVLIVSPYKHCVAAKALYSEGIEYRIIHPVDDHSYGRIIAGAWQIGESFINVEHDIAPWPGALQALEDCTEPLCAYQYLIRGELTTALGCIKFSDTIMKRYANACEGWEATHWMHLDARVISSLEWDRKIKVHLHEPPVAHVR